MLELKQIKKDYPAGEDIVHALKGIDITFRESEFVSILGPSGCGKTTLLNIIGGLDGYTSGDLIINGRSTKDFKDRDWDAYRNHSVGFVFQSYNLIPHQTVLQNVEIALTLSGVGKTERRERAVKALEEVGLGNQLHKRPNQMSGGQMQRVAIARALVNNPDIILADEPTGALDTETSVQVMEILKEVSRNRLVVMVTHNPELAEKYSSRIIRMLDGNLTDDSRPYTDAEQAAHAQAEEETRAAEAQADGQSEGKKKKKEKMPSMSFWTAFRLSLKNLFTKKGRTILTAFAGSIGIIGIALILAVSSGMTGYIGTVQEETLSTYPVALRAEETDMMQLMQTFMMPDTKKPTHGNDAVYKKPVIYDLANSIGSIETKQNDLRTFKTYLEKELENEDGKFSRAVTGVQYGYDLDLLVYTKNEKGDILVSDAQELLAELLQKYFGADDMSGMAGMIGNMGMGTSMNLWEELLPAKNGAPVNELLYKQYDVVYGTWPGAYNEIVLVLNEYNELDDMTLYILGLMDESFIDDVVGAVVNKTPLDVEEQKWSYEEICGTEVKCILNSDCYKQEGGRWVDLRKSEAGLNLLYNNAETLKITGIVKPNKKAGNTMLSGTIGYTNLLSKYVVAKAEQSEAVKAQKATPTIDVLTGKPFKTTTLTDEGKKEALMTYASDLDTEGQARLYERIQCVMPADMLQEATADALKEFDGEEGEALLRQTIAETIAAQMNVSPEVVLEYIAEYSKEQLIEMALPSLQQQIKAGYAGQVMENLKDVPTDTKVTLLNRFFEEKSAAECALYYEADNVMDFSKVTYEENLLELGWVDLDAPTSINIYAASFADKDIIADEIIHYNQSVDEDHQIQYTDYVALMMSAVTTIIDAITYVLIAFVAISLIVSSIMVGVITLISVQERTKEIGVLRAIGASKHNVSSMFNAETIIIGFAAGAFGVLITYLLCIPINLILHALTGIGALSAFLHPLAALVLIVISVLLTLISGLIPSRSAAKKDPVVALRTE